MMKRLVCLAFALPLLVTACGGSGSKQALGVPDIVALREAAARLAETELVRLQALEEPRKEKLILSPTMNPFTIGTGIWSRVYREYTGYEIKDIRLKDSLMHPVEFEITYAFKVFATPGRNEDFKGAKELAEAEHEFEFRRETSLDLVYQADLSGEVGELPPDPPHDQYHPREFTQQLPEGEILESGSAERED